jgi:cytochrome b
MALRTRQTVLYLPMRVWDAPTRLFHWLIVLLIPACYATAKLGWMDLHLDCGYAVLALVLFRLAWGFVGSDTARFGRFLVSPLAGLRHLAGLRVRERDTQVGHNAAGGWMVLLMLLLIAAEVISGLGANDGLGVVAGPLAARIPERLSDLLTVVHGVVMNLIIAAVVLHLLAIGAYAVLKGQDLVRPMITGKKRLPAATRAPRMASPLLAAAILALAAAVTLLVATRL